MPTIQAQIPHPYVPQVSNAATQGALAIYGRSVEESLRRLEASVNALTTSDIPEGSNLYYTDARARAALSATAPITYNSGTGAIGANAASVNTFNYLVQRDGSGGFLAGAVTVTNLTDSALTLGSVAFAGTGGLLSQDNAHFFWDNTADTLKLTQDSLSGTALQLTKSEHTSTLASAFRLFDSTAQETVGFTSWDGGGGAGGYGVLALASTCDDVAQRVGEFSFKNNFNGYRLATILGQTGTAADTGEVAILLGTGAGGFAYAQYIGANGTGFQISGAPSAKVHIAACDGTPSTAPLKFETGILLSPVENGALEYDGSSLYITAGGVRSPLTTGAAYVHPNHTGDVTSVADGATTIAANAVTFAKFQQIATDKILGRDTVGTGNVETLDVSGGLEFTGTGIRRSALTGEVTATAGSNATTIAALAVTDAKVATANKDGAAATPSMRTLGTGAAQACAGNDARLSDARTPTAHATSHVTGGTDVIANAVAAGNAGLMTGADKTKLDGIATGANLYIHPNHTGDVGSVADGATTIAADVVTYAKMQNVSAISRLLGRGAAAGAGDPEEIILGTNLSMSGTTLNAAGGGGGNSVTTTLAFGATFTDKAETVVTGQAWVTATGEIVAQVRTPTGVDPDEMRLLDFKPVISNLVVGTGFTVSMYSEAEAKGDYDVMCVGV